jgi:hypothetical protein
MKFFRLDLLTLLISLFILNSCKNQDAVGLGVNSGNQLNSNLIDSTTIVINTVPEDSVATYSSGSPLAKNPLGYFIDPLLGTTISSIATDLNLPSQTAYTPPVGTITIDSARLVMQYTGGFYGDSITSTYTANVYQLQHVFNLDTTYFNTKNFGNYSSTTPLGSVTFNARPHDSIKVYSIIAGAPDTLIKVAPQIRIPINPAFINNNLFSASSAVIGSNAVFQNNIKGLYVAINPAKSTGPGGILMFTPNDSLAVYYRAVHGSTIDTGVINLPVLHTAMSIQHNYSQAVKTELANTTTGSRSTFYLQGTGGLRAKVSFPYLLKNLRSSLLKKDSDVLINRAELVITPAPGTYIPYSPLQQITMYQLDLASQRIELQDANSADPRSQGETIFGGFYAPAQNEYHFIITAYLQDLLWGKQVNYGTYIAPVDTSSTSTAVQIQPTPQVAGRTVAVGSNLSSPYRIVLHVIYTKIARPQ